MSLEIWLTYTLASILILIIPGPTIILVVNRALTQGTKSVLPLSIGVLLGDFTAMSLSLLGLGALLATSATLFTILKWLGAIYLIYLGVKQWRTKTDSIESWRSNENRTAGELLRSSFIVTALNPKGIAFFVAFMPQFIDPNLSTAFQLSVLGGTFLILATINAALYAIFAGRLGILLKNKRRRKWLNRTGGSALIGAGIITAGLKQS